MYLHPQDTDLAGLARALSNPSRVHVIRHLLAHPDISVSELVERTSIPQPTVSQHLAQLRRAELVRVRREGRQAFYTVDGVTLRRFARFAGMLATRSNV